VISDKIAKRSFVIALLLLCAGAVFVAGLTIGDFKLWPYETMRGVWQTANMIVKFGKPIPKGRRTLAPTGASREIFTIHDRSKIVDGYYVILGWDGSSGRYAAWLYDSHGVKRHTWRLNYREWDPDGPTDGSDYPHGFYVLPEGSIVAGFDKGDVMVRLDACSRPVWIKQGRYHHQMSRADDGSFWSWRARGTAYDHYNYIENFDWRTGKKIRELELVDDIIKPLGASSVIFGVRPDYPFRNHDSRVRDRSVRDLFHPNDVDVLSKKLAPQFPMFEAGDLLLSFRAINLISVVDSTSGSVKWWSTGPWIAQHDADFTADGRISVFDNNRDRDRSEIIKTDPATHAVSNELFAGNVKFYTKSMGAHQYLPNGNVLLVIPNEGRVLEVTPEGNLVMEFNNLTPKFSQYNEHVSNGMWAPPDYFDKLPECPSG